MSTIAALLDEYFNAARIVQITRMCQLAPYVVMVYDHILTFDQEVEHIWKRSRSLSTVLYVILRYAGTAVALLSAFGTPLHLSVTHVWLISIVLPAFLAQAHASNEVRLELFLARTSIDVPLAVPLCYTVMINSCQVFVRLQGWPASITLWLVQFILQMRLYALYNYSKKLLFLVGGAYVAEIVAMSVILGIANAADTGVNEPAPGIYICSVATISAPRVFYSFWLPPVIFESILCLLAIRIGIQRSKEQFRPALISGTRLLNVVIKGNVVYFVGILVACVVNAAMWQNLGFLWLEVPEGFPQAMEVIAGCRLILHIRSAASSDPNTTMTAPIQMPMQHFTPKSDLDEA
ncbi:hypothetical protein HYDPIDRAFT_41839 [Hydnomerulius pinastri MD-312]|uniref:DUF6533 domain-containing protein n=1 Tax=Hydnomerulius pinastri MD-312 TaxID=994086 RepID=A0A0C9VAP9_9AGAM|nr:hypothetical protein HYDPIDRAFT_41839 [Hydnomerulius pinastri MD-312]